MQIDGRVAAVTDGSRLGGAAAADFGTLVAPLIPQALRWASAMLQDPHRAEDVVQEAATRAWRRLDTLRDPAQPGPWFFAIVSNQCRSNIRRSSREALLARLWLYHQAPAPEPDIERTAVQSALLSLGFEHRRVLILHYYLDLTLEDVAKLTGTNVGTVKSRLHRGIAKLRVRLDPAGTWEDD
jgi:RNA polymerase sigma-70 factor, ECF subfamily